MKIEQQLSKHLREVIFGRNWTASSLKQHLDGVDWKMATHKIDDFNTIAVLVFHLNYYVDAMNAVLQGNPLTAKDELSFTHPALNSEGDWQQLVNKVYADVEKCCSLIEAMPTDLIWEHFTDATYGSYYRNIQGTIEHAHYHLGQIVLLKKLFT